MTRYLPICAIAGALALFATTLGTAQAAPVVGLSAVAGDQAHASSMVDEGRLAPLARAPQLVVALAPLVTDFYGGSGGLIGTAPF